MTRPPNPQLVDSLLAITTDLIADKGADRVTLREVAQRAGVTATTIHYYFEDRRGLFEAAKLRAMAELDAAIVAAVDQATSATTQLCSLGDAFRSWALEHPHEFALLFEHLPSPEGPSDGLSRQYHTAYSRVRSIYERGRQTGEFVIDDADLQAAVGFATIFGIVDLCLNRRLPAENAGDVSDVFSRAMQEILVTLVPEAAAARAQVTLRARGMVRTVTDMGTAESAGTAQPATGIVVELPATSTFGGRPLADEELDELAAAGSPEATQHGLDQQQLD